MPNKQLSERARRPGACQAPYGRDPYIKCQLSSDHLKAKLPHTHDDGAGNRRQWEEPDDAGAAGE